jgi:hypothetical protein
MRNHFTPNDLIRFIYRETSSKEDAQIRLQLAEDSELAVEFHRLIETVNMLDELKLEPSETSINLILEYSQEQIEEASHA